MNKPLLILTDKDQISDEIREYTQSYQVYETNDLDFAISKIEKREVDAVLFDFDDAVINEVIKTFKLYKENNIPYIVLTDHDTVLFTDEEYIRRDLCNSYTLGKIIDNNIYKAKLEEEIETYKHAGHFSPGKNIDKREIVKKRKEEILPKLVEFKKTLRQ